MYLEKHLGRFLSDKPGLISQLEQEEDPWIPDQPTLEQREVLSESRAEFSDVMIKLEMEEEPQGLDHLESEPNKPFSDCSSDAMSQLEKGEPQGILHQLGSEEKDISFDHHLGFPDVIIKEEEPWSQGHEESANLADDQSGFPAVIIKLEPKEEPWLPDLQIPEESVTVQSIRCVATQATAASWKQEIQIKLRSLV
uniref:Uncharacterized protein n=1 Tax=Sphaerodactylus townsendi TaxID=933632 RepID=A0ACB8EGF1_9SAUR